MHPQFACAQQRLQVPLDSAAAQKQNLHFMERVSLEVLQANVHGTEFGWVPYARSEIFSDRPRAHPNSSLAPYRAHWPVSGTFHEVLIFMICTSSHCECTENNMWILNNG